MKNLFSFLFMLLFTSASAQVDTAYCRVILLFQDSTAIMAVEAKVYIPPAPGCRCPGAWRVINYKNVNGELISDDFKHDGKIKNVFDFYFKKPEDIWHH